MTSKRGCVLCLLLLHSSSWVGREPISAIKKKELGACEFALSGQLADRLDARKMLSLLLLLLAPLSADPGAEKPETYEYQRMIAAWMHARGIPYEIVRYVPRRFKHWPPYYTILAKI